MSSYRLKHRRRGASPDAPHRRVSKIQRYGSEDPPWQPPTPEREPPVITSILPFRLLFLLPSWRTTLKCRLEKRRLEEEMRERIEHFSDVLLWETPVLLRIGRGVTETIDGPNDALDQMWNRWPAERGPKFEIAKLCCRLAVQHYGSLEEAREAFLDAAVEVGILA